MAVGPAPNKKKVYISRKTGVNARQFIAKFIKNRVLKNSFLKLDKILHGKKVRNTSDT